MRDTAYKNHQSLTTTSNQLDIFVLLKAFFKRGQVARLPELKNRNVVSLGSRIIVLEHRRKLTADKLRQAYDEMVAFGRLFGA